MPNGKNQDTFRLRGYNPGTLRRSEAEKQPSKITWVPEPSISTEMHSWPAGTCWLRARYAGSRNSVNPLTKQAGF